MVAAVAVSFSDTQGQMERVLPCRIQLAGYTMRVHNRLLSSLSHVRIPVDCVCAFFSTCTDA